MARCVLALCLLAMLATGALAQGAKPAVPKACSKFKTIEAFGAAAGKIKAACKPGDKTCPPSCKAALQGVSAPGLAAAAAPGSRAVMSARLHARGGGRDCGGCPSACLLSCDEQGSLPWFMNRPAPTACSLTAMPPAAARWPQAPLACWQAGLPLVGAGGSVSAVVAGFKVCKLK